MAFIGDPPGTLKAYAGGAAPEGYLMCDGAEVSRSTYAILWNTIGTAYGAGNGTTTFNLPDLRGRVPTGVGSHTDVNALGKNEGGTGNSSTIPLADRRQKHKHVVNDAGHSHLIDTFNHSYVNGADNNTFAQTNDFGSTPNNANIGVAKTATTGVTVGPQTNVPTDSPAFVTFNYIIKT